jgi:hypothetical protein
MISVILPEFGYHLSIQSLGQFVIFNCITGFERHGFFILSQLSAISITSEIYLPPNISTLNLPEIGFDPD